MEKSIIYTQDLNRVSEELRSKLESEKKKVLHSKFSSYRNGKHNPEKFKITLIGYTSDGKNILGNPLIINSILPKEDITSRESFRSGITNLEFLSNENRDKKIMVRGKFLTINGYPYEIKEPLNNRLIISTPKCFDGEQVCAYSPIFGRSEFSLEYDLIGKWRILESMEEQYELERSLTEKNYPYFHYSGDPRTGGRYIKTFGIKPKDDLRHSSSRSEGKAGLFFDNYYVHYRPQAREISFTEENKINPVSLVSFLTNKIDGVAKIEYKSERQNSKTEIEEYLKYRLDELNN